MSYPATYFKSILDNYIEYQRQEDNVFKAAASLDQLADHPRAPRYAALLGLSAEWDQLVQRIKSADVPVEFEVFEALMEFRQLVEERE